MPMLELFEAMNSAASVAGGAVAAGAPEVRTSMLVCVTVVVREDAAVLGPIAYVKVVV